MEKKNTPNKMEEKRKRIVLALVLSSYLVVGIDGSLVITAIAQIAEELHMDNMAMSWVQNAYVLAFGGFMLAGGRLGDIYGRKLTFCTSIVLFCGYGSCCARTDCRLFSRQGKSESCCLVWKYLWIGVVRGVGTRWCYYELYLMAMGIFGQYSNYTPYARICLQMAI